MTALKRYWSPTTGLFLGIWLALLVLGRTQLFRDPGTFWHTAMGERTLAARQLFAIDPFSFTFSGRTWIPHEWLAECLMAATHRVSGLDGLLLASATTLALVYAWLGHRLIRAGLHWLPTLMILLVAIAASSTNFHARPHVASLAFFALTYGMLADYEARRLKLVHLAWLIPLDILWTNLHGAVLGGMASLGLAVGWWTCSWLIGRETPITRGRDAVWLWLLVLACGLTMFVNPYGARLPATWMEIMTSPALPKFIQEHAPPSPHSPVFWAILLLGAIYTGAMVGTLPGWPRATWLIPFAWLLLGLSRIRHAPLFGISAVVALAAVLPVSRLAAWLARPGRDLYQSPTKSLGRFDWRQAMLPAMLVLGTLVLQSANVRAPIVGRGWAGLDPSVWPVELLPALQEAEREHPEGARVFNDYPLGGFLIYHTPKLKVFIDDRCELYGDAWLEDYDRASMTDPALMDGWLAKYAIDYVLVAPASLFDKHISTQAGWSIQGRCPVANLYRRDPARQSQDATKG